MKDPSSLLPSRSKRSKLKLLVSFNGTFCRRPPSRKFRYTGGETRFISVDRNIPFSKLKSKITDLIRPNGSYLTRFSLKYHVSESSFSSGGGVVDREEEPQPIPISLESDDDVGCMVEEYEMAELRGKSLTRLWVFVCDNSSNDNEFVNKHALLSQEGDGFCEGKNGFAVNISHHLGRTNDSNKSINATAPTSKKFTDDYSLRKMVLRQQLLSKKLDEISSLRVIVERSEMALNTENEDCEASSMESSNPEPDSPSSFVPKDVNFGCDMCMKVTDYDKYMNAHNMANENVRKVLPVIESNSRPLIPKDGNLGPRLDVSKGCFFGQTCTVFVNGRGNPVQVDMAYDGACTGANHNFSLPIDAVLSSLPHTRAVDAQMDLLTGPGSENLDNECQAVDVKALDKVGMNAEAPFHINQGMHLCNQEEVMISGFGSPYNLSCRSGTELSCNSRLLDTESGCGSNNYWSCAHTLDGHSASAVEYNLSLASSRKSQLPSSSSTGVNKSESLLKLQSNDLELIDEEHLYSGPIVEKSSDTASNSSPDDVERRGNNDNGTRENQQNLYTNSSIVEKDENKKTKKCLKVDGDFPADIAAFYTHLANGDLQNIKNSDLECIKELGSGNFGRVYYGKWKGSDVAIKRIKPSCFTDGRKMEDRLVADFWKEAHILRRLHHPNIVALYGVVTDGPVNSLATVTEYMVNGSLRQVLRRKDRTIDRRKRLIIAMDAAFGMEYLHEKNIVHFDLKSHNFLMNTRDPQRPICKIGDLGLSKIKQRTLVSGGVRGTIPWMAPELLSGKNLVSEKVDVYSFAIVMWELLSGEEPYADMRSEEIIAGIIRGNLRPEIPSWCDPAWRSLMERCWSSEPDSRPPFSEIAKELRAMAAAINFK